MTTLEQQVTARLWTDGLAEASDQSCKLEAERNEPNEIAVHTFIDGEGSKVSFYLDREEALSLAHRLLEAVVLR